MSGRCIHTYMYLDGRLGSLVHLSAHVSAMNDANTLGDRLFLFLEHTKAVVSSVEALIALDRDSLTRPVPTL